VVERGMVSGRTILMPCGFSGVGEGWGSESGSLASKLREESESVGESVSSLSVGGGG